MFRTKYSVRLSGIGLILVGTLWLPRTVFASDPGAPPPNARAEISESATAADADLDAFLVGAVIDEPLQATQAASAPPGNKEGPEVGIKAGLVGALLGDKGFLCRWRCGCIRFGRPLPGLDCGRDQRGISAEICVDTGNDQRAITDSCSECGTQAFNSCRAESCPLRSDASKLPIFLSCEKR